MPNQDIVNYALSCKKTDVFSKLEDELYKDFPYYKNFKKIFSIETRKIDVKKTIEENGIKNKSVINIFKVEN